jgi:beta-glucanase (GH16 family)
MLKFKFYLKSKMGLIPGTSRTEARTAELEREYEEFLSYEKTLEPKRFRELEEIVGSSDFKDCKKQINNQKFKGSQPWQKFRDYTALKNSRQIRGYFRFINSREFNDFLNLDGSDEIREFEELGIYLNSPEFKSIKRSSFKESEDWRKYLEYKRLKKTPQIRDYYRIKNSKNYQSFREIEGSKTLEHYRELHQLVNASEFLVKKKTMSSSDFKKTSDFAKEKEYKSLGNDSRIKAYQSLARDKAFGNFSILENSREIEEFENLEKFINSSGFGNARKDFELRKATHLHKINDYKTLKKSVRFRAYYKLKNSKDLRHFRNMRESADLERFKELEKYIGSPEFKETRAWLESRDKFKKTPEYQQLAMYRELKKSKKIKWYFNLAESGKFDEIKKWKLVFYDDFTGRELDRNNWLTSFYWGKELLQQGYSLGSDLHYYSDGKNHEVEHSLLRLQTKKESVTGQAWDNAIGFFPKEFEYSSGLINTGESFRQLYGAFEAKVRLHSSPLVYHAFWMLSDKAVPHVDVFRFSGKSKKRIELNNYWEQGGSGEVRRNTDSVHGLDFSGGFYIFRLEWYPDRLIWKINNTIVKTEEAGVPNEPMYLLLSSGVEGEANGTNGLPVSLDIDWVKCYQLEQVPVRS